MARHTIITLELAIAALLTVVACALAADTGNDTDPTNSLPAVTPNTSSYALQRAFMRDEAADRWDELEADNPVVSGCLHSTAGGLTGTFTATPCIAYPGGYRISETSATISYSGLAASSDTCWVIATMADSGSAGTFTRYSTTHYAIDCTSSSRPSLPADSAWLMEVTITASAIAAVTDMRFLAGSAPSVQTFPITAYGAACGDSGDDGVAVQAAVTAACAATSAATTKIIDFPTNGVCIMRQTSDTTPVVTIGCNNIWFRGNGASLRADTSDQPDTKAEQDAYAWAFKAIGRSNIRFTDFHWDGDKDDAEGTTDPRLGFFAGVKTSNVWITRSTFKDSTQQAGFILGYGYNVVDSSVAQIENWWIEDNYFTNAPYAILIAESQRNINIRGNHLEAMDVCPNVGSNGPAYTDAYSGTATCRGIRITGFVQSTSSTGVIRDIDVSYNHVNGAGIAIEIWNQDSTNGRNPTSAYGVTVANNVLTDVMYGINVNSFSKVSITDNVYKRLRSVSGYAGDTHSMTAPENEFGNGIEPSPGFDFVVSGNHIDCNWVDSTDTSLPYGIQHGVSTLNIRTEGLIEGNYITACDEGIRNSDSKNTHVIGNVLDKNRVGYRLSCTGSNSAVDCTNIVFGYNDVVADSTMADAANGYDVWLQPSSGTPSWDVRVVGNNIKHKPATTVTTYAFVHSNISGTVHFHHNYVEGWKFAGLYMIADKAFISDNTYDSGNASPGTAVSAWQFVRTDGMDVITTNETLFNTRAYYGVTDVSTATDTYVFGHVFHDGDVDRGATALGGTIPSSDIVYCTASKCERYNAATAKAGFYHGTGSPEASQTAAIGSIYQRDDGSATVPAFWVKASGTGNTGWVAQDSIVGTFTFDPANAPADGVGETKTFTCTGAALGDIVAVAAPYDIAAVTVTAYVASADNCALRFQNETGGAGPTLASGTWEYRVWKQ